MFQLQRYSWNEPKIATDVGIPEFLHFCERDWELIAVVCHIGTLPSNGHYVAHVKTNSGVWRCADDMEIEPEDFQAVRQSAAQDGLLPEEVSAPQVPVHWLRQWRQHSACHVAALPA